jgi:iron complex outermembrane receptor protein
MSRLRDLTLVALTISSLPALAVPADGGDPVKYDLKIEKQSLSAALQEFAAQSGIQIIFFAKVTDGHEAPALKGKYTAADAVAHLLDHSDLTFQQLNPKTIEVEPKAATNDLRKNLESPFLGAENALRLAQADSPGPSDSGQPTVAAPTAGPPTAAAPSAESAPAAPDVSEVVVTGTRIRGVAPVGSTLMTVDQATIQESGLASTNDILNTNPAILDLGIGPHTTGATSIQNGFSLVNSPDIHGLGIQATLSLVNGHRAWEQGVVGDVFDPSSIPAHMLERIEVVPDGTSPIYGADAIAGTVNYVLRKPEDVVESYVSGSWMKGTNTWYATGILGHVWGDDDHSGGFIMGYQRTQTGALAASAYPTLYNNNFAPFGGSPSSAFAAPGNVLVGGATYAIPYGQNGQTLTLSQLGASGSVNRQNIWGGTPAPDISQRDVRNTLVVNYYQNINDWLQFFGDSMYDHDDLSGLGESTANDLAASVPNTNPYSPCNPSHYPGGVVTGPAPLVAACAKGALTVNYNDLSQIGQQLSWGTVKGWETSNGFHIKLPDDWQITPQASLNQSLYYTARTSIGAPSAATYNYFCDPTTNNCPAQPGAIPVTVPPYQGTALASPTWANGQFFQLQGDGPLFTLPGGKVRLAAGVEDDFWGMERHSSAWTNPYKRDRAGYAELYVPIVGRGNAVPGIQSLELDLAGRVDDYTDTGTTRNPKIGLNWTPIASLKFHGSFGTSFRGPPIQTEINNSPIQWITSVVPATAISSAVCPQCTNTALYGVNGASKLVYQESVGVDPELSPETSRSFSAGFDWVPDFIPGLQTSVNWWYIKYVNQVGTPEFNAGPAGAINAQVFNAHIIYNPTFFPQLAQYNPYSYYTPNPTGNFNDPNCAAVYGKRITTQALFNDFLACSNDNTGGQIVTGATSKNPNDVLGYTYYGNVNAGSTLGSGFDLNAGYSWRNGWGNWKTIFTGEYIPRFDVAVIQGAPVINEAGHFGYVLKFKGRLQLNYQRDFGFGSLSPSLFLNYDSRYKEDPQYVPVGVPQSYGDINAHVTLDTAIVYNTGTTFDSWLGKDITITLSSQNLLNENPPRVLNNLVQFDPAYGWPPARVIQLAIGKSW